jgi:rhodanese-related sulfurtransferase
MGRKQIEELFHAALERPPDERAAWLAETCADDPDLRCEVEELLRYDGAAESFIEENALAAAAQQRKAEASVTTKVESLTGQQIGAYRILAPLGRGGMGEVHLALDPRLGRKVAIKLLPAAFTHDREGYGSRLIPLGQFANRIGELDPEEDIVVHCKMGGRSAKAYEVLKKAGFTRIKNLKGGILAWADQVDRTMARY